MPLGPKMSVRTKIAYMVGLILIPYSMVGRVNMRLGTPVFLVQQIGNKREIPEVTCALRGLVF